MKSFNETFDDHIDATDGSVVLFKHQFNDIQSDARQDLLAQIAIKDEVLKQFPPMYCTELNSGSTSPQKGCYCQECTASRGKDNTLTNSPTAAKELLEQNERMRVAIQKAIICFNSTSHPCDDCGKCIVCICKQALPTTNQPAK